MSYYGDGRVSADFCGTFARQKAPGRGQRMCFQVYFQRLRAATSPAGKFNDGAKENRPVLREPDVQGDRGGRGKETKRPGCPRAWDWRFRSR